MSTDALRLVSALLAAALAFSARGGEAAHVKWEPLGISGGGAMFTPAISPADPQLMMVNCDMSAAYISTDGGANWKMIHHSQLRTNTQCKPAFHPTDPNIVYGPSGARLMVSRDRVIGTLNLGRLREGAFSQGDVDFLTQVANQIAIGIENALNYQQVTEARERLVEERNYLNEEIRTDHDFEAIIGQSPALKRILKQAELVAPTASTVLIQG
ncbi:MAG: GAF domain-containing protein, partial [Planctomycetota bacterium]